MDKSRLRSLAVDGFQGVLPSELTELALWCRDWCEASGDARYCVVSDTLRTVDEWWLVHDEYGGVPQPLVGELEALIVDHLGTVLDLDDPAAASQVARTMREQVVSLLSGPAEWRAQGWVTRTSEDL